jgi:hypothetical protein
VRRGVSTFNKNDRHQPPNQKGIPAGCSLGSGFSRRRFGWVSGAEGVAGMIERRRSVSTLFIRYIRYTPLSVTDVTDNSGGFMYLSKTGRQSARWYPWESTPALAPSRSFTSKRASSNRTSRVVRAPSLPCSNQDLSSRAISVCTMAGWAPRAGRSSPRAAPAPRPTGAVRHSPFHSEASWTARRNGPRCNAPAGPVTSGV